MAVEKVKGAQALRHGKGAASSKLVLKTDRKPGQCLMLECDETTEPRKKWCSKCKLAVRKLQLAENAVAWKKRVKAGTAGHHVTYKGAATVFTLKNRKLAEKIVASGRSMLKSQAQLRNAVKQVPEDLRKAVRRAG